MSYPHVGLMLTIAPPWESIPSWNLSAPLQAHLSVSSRQASSEISLNVNTVRTVPIILVFVDGVYQHVPIVHTQKGRAACALVYCRAMCIESCPRDSWKERLEI